MKDASLDMITPGGLSRLLELEKDERWTERDAAAALLQQLDTPLLPDLAAAPGAEPERLVRLTGAEQPPRTFLALLNDPQPAEELLGAVKAWAKHIRDVPANPLSPGPATVLYYAAIAAAMARLGRCITTLPDTELRGGFAWSRQQRGAERLGELFAAALRKIGPG